MTGRQTARDLFEWADNCKNIWTTLGNSEAAQAAEHIPIRESPLPHYNAPTSLNDDASPLVIPELARTVTLGVELACRMATSCENVAAADADKFIGGYHVFVAVRDSSHYEFAVQCSNFPHLGKEGDATIDYDYEVPQAWADGFAILGTDCRDIAEGFPRDAAMCLQVEDLPPVQASTSAYAHGFPQVIEAITRFVCLEEGAIISLGRAGDVITLPPERKLPAAAKLSARIDGVGDLSIAVVDQRSEDNYYTRSYRETAAGECKKGLFI